MRRTNTAAATPAHLPTIGTQFDFTQDDHRHPTSGTVVTARLSRGEDEEGASGAAVILAVSPGYPDDDKYVVLYGDLTGSGTNMRATLAQSFYDLDAALSYFKD